MQQHPNYASAIEKLGGQTQSFLCKDDDVTLARVQVIQRKVGPVKMAWVPRGPAWSLNLSQHRKRSVLDRLSHALPPRTIRLVTPETTDDIQMLRSLKFREVAAAQTYAVLDLSPPAADRLAKMHGKWRNRLRHGQSQRTRFTSRPFHAEKDEMLLRLEKLQRRRMGYRALPSTFTQAWALANRKAAQLFTAEDQTGLIAFIIVLIHAPGASYHIGWSSDRGRLASCHNILLWRASNWLSERGIREFDLGLIDPVQSPGLTRFKLGIGAVSHTIGPTMVAMPRFGLPKLLSRAA